MERTAWSDDRIDDVLVQLREEIRDMRAEMRAGFSDVRDEVRVGLADVRAELRVGLADARAETRSIRSELFQLKIFMLAGLVTILAAVIALHG
jgi:hypothetical protein